MRPVRWLWLALAAGLLAPVWALSYYSLKQLKRQVRAARENRQRSLEDSHRQRLRAAAESLERRMTERISLDLSAAREILADPAGRRRSKLFADPWILHPFLLDPDGTFAYPARPEEPSPEPEEDFAEWTERLDRAQALENEPAGADRAVARYQDCLGHARAPGAIRRAAQLLGSFHLRGGASVRAAGALERGWSARARPIDELSALIGTQRVSCLNDLGREEACAAAANELLEEILKAGGWDDPWKLLPVLGELKRKGRPSGASPALLARQDGLWTEIEHLEQRRRLWEILEGWALGQIEASPSNRDVRYTCRISPEDPQLLAFERSGDGTAAGAWLDFGRIEEWLRSELPRDPSRPGWRLSRVHARAGPALYSEIFPAQLALWELSAPPPAAPGGPDAWDRQILLGRLLVASSALVTLASFGFLVWGLRREWTLQKMKARFLSNVSHELRTPLSVIRTAAETLSMGRVRDAEHANSHQGLIAREAQRLSRMVENLLDFNRIDAGRAKHQPEPVALSGYLETFFSEARTLHPDPEIRWEAQIPGGLPEIQADPDSLRSALLNLVGNAVKYASSDGEKLVRLSARADGGRVLIEVEDRGIGIPVGERARVLERFYRASNAEAKRIPGSGIGLSIVAHVAAAHGGQVEIEDAQPNGTRVRLSLPV